MIERPEGVEDKHLEYLEELRESRSVNPITAVPYLQKKFGVAEDLAQEILVYWFKTFDPHMEPRSWQDELDSFADGKQPECPSVKKST